VIRSAATETFAARLEGARCWGLELDARYRVLAVTVEPDPLRAAGTAGELQLLCFPVSTFLVAVTHPREDGRTALVTFGLEDLPAVSQRFGGAQIDGVILGRPEPRPGAWGPRMSLEGRSSAGDGTRRTFTAELTDADGARLRCFARFDDLELRDAAGSLLLATGAGDPLAEDRRPGSGPEPLGPLRF
jgi:hypothetical protein